MYAVPQPHHLLQHVSAAAGSSVLFAANLRSPALASLLTASATLRCHVPVAVVVDMALAAAGMLADDANQPRYT
jgi:hypothetical protein